MLLLVPDTLQQQITDIHNLLVQYHQEKESWVKLYLPSIVALIVIGVTILGQVFVFKLNKRKDVKLKIADSYGVFTRKSIPFIMTFREFNKHSILAKRHLFLYDHYFDCWIEDTRKVLESDLSDTEKLAYYESYKEGYSKYRKLSDETMVKLKELMEKLFEQKLELIEIVNQIHFYRNDNKLRNAITQFRNTQIIEVEFKESIGDIEMDDFYRILYEPKVERHIIEYKRIIDRISELMLEIH